MQGNSLCPYCGKIIGEEDNLKVCPDCGVHHHLECWNSRGGCSTFKCNGGKPKPKIVCGRCGQECEDNQRFCPSCGTELSQSRSQICENCGALLSETQSYCPSCGHRKSVQDLMTVDSKPETPKQPISAEKKINPAVGFAVAVGCILVIALIIFLIVKGCSSFEKKYNLRKAYDSFCTSLWGDWAELSSNGDTLTVDTNPNDIAESKALTADLTAMSERSAKIKEINKYLGFSDSVYTKMIRTRALDGMQTDSIDGIKVTWTYHPDHGLEVIYELIK